MAMDFTDRLEVACGIMEAALLDVARQARETGRPDLARYAETRHREAVESARPMREGGEVE